MIKSIDIGKFGIFNDYQWKQFIGNDFSFQMLNIIYGRNYSGKTTLSRIIQSIEDKKIAEKYENSTFNVTFDDKVISESNLEDCKECIRVYNTTFVKRNLSWLENEDGNIEPFTVLGEFNKELDEKIKEIEGKLGKIDERKGFLFDFETVKTNCEIKKIAFEKVKASLDSSIKSKANDHIKLEPNLFIASTQKKTYQTNDLLREIDLVIKNIDSYILTNEDIGELTSQLKEKAFENPINEFKESKPNFEKHYLNTKDLLNKKIKPGKTITDLIDNSILENWVREGIEKHKDKRATCAFCGNNLSKEIWEKLDAHFNKESENLRTKIHSEIEVLIKAKAGIKEFFKLTKDDFYTSFHPIFVEIESKWITLSSNYSSSLDSLIKELQQRGESIFKDKEIPVIPDFSEDIYNLIIEINELIRKNKDKTKTLEFDQQAIRNKLRLSEVAQFVKAIDYQERIKDIIEKEKEYNDQKEVVRKIDQTITFLNEEKIVLEANAKDESAGAQTINEYLTRYFGHDDLKLVAETDSTNTKFIIRRGAEKANNLSEGECSLISFCYFIAKMKDELNGTTRTFNPIIYIDDPISSLDCNHVFFMFSLIESVIAKPKKYSQLFISTHNLDFLKYLKRLTTPYLRDKPSINHFIIERKKKQNDGRAFINLMPKHIKDYVTEFNYLFGEIFKLYKEVNGDRKKCLENTYNQFYNLPNNIRKFLECYLFYRYPNNENPLDNLDKLFDNNTPVLINRVINEYSHLQYIDRGWQPIDVQEMEDCVTLLINKIKEKDESQFNALVESLN